jgi:hypothetical protein
MFSAIPIVMVCIFGLTFIDQIHASVPIDSEARRHASTFCASVVIGLTYAILGQYCIRHLVSRAGAFWFGTGIMLIGVILQWSIQSESWLLDKVPDVTCRMIGPPLLAVALVGSIRVCYIEARAILHDNQLSVSSVQSIINKWSRVVKSIVTIASWIFLVQCILLVVLSLLGVSRTTIHYGTDLGLRTVAIVVAIAIIIRLLSYFTIGLQRRRNLKDQPDLFLIEVLLNLWNAVRDYDSALWSRAGVFVPHVSYYPRRYVLALLSEAAYVYERYVQRSILAGNSEGNSEVVAGICQRADTIRSMSFNVVFTTPDARETLRLSVEQMLEAASLGSWGAFPVGAATASARRGRFTKLLPTLRFGGMIAILTAGLVAASIRYPNSSGFDSIRGSVLLTLSVLLAQVILAKVDPSSADIVANASKMITRKDDN